MLLTEIHSEQPFSFYPSATKHATYSFSTETESLLLWQDSLFAKNRDALSVSKPLGSAHSFKTYRTRPDTLFALFDSELSTVKLPDCAKTSFVSFDFCPTDFDVSEVAARALISTTSSLFVYGENDSTPLWTYSDTTASFAVPRMNKKVPTVFFAVDSAGGKLRVFDARKPQPILSLGDGPLVGATAVWSCSSGTQLAVGTHQQFALWDLRNTGEPIFVENIPVEHLLALSGGTFVFASERKICLMRDTHISPLVGYPENSADTLDNGFDNDTVLVRSSRTSYVMSLSNSSLLRETLFVENTAFFLEEGKLCRQVFSPQHKVVHKENAAASANSKESKALLSIVDRFCKNELAELLTETSEPADDSAFFDEIAPPNNGVGVAAFALALLKNDCVTAAALLETKLEDAAVFWPFAFLSVALHTPRPSEGLLQRVAKKVENEEARAFLAVAVSFWQNDQAALFKAAGSINTDWRSLLLALIVPGIAVPSALQVTIALATKKFDGVAAATQFGNEHLEAKLVALLLHAKPGEAEKEKQLETLAALLRSLDQTPRTLKHQTFDKVCKHLSVVKSEPITIKEAIIPKHEPKKQSVVKKETTLSVLELSENDKLQKIVDRVNSAVAAKVLVSEVSEKLTAFFAHLEKSEIDKAEKIRTELVKKHWKTHKDWLFNLTTIINIYKKNRKSAIK